MATDWQSKFEVMSGEYLLNEMSALRVSSFLQFVSPPESEWSKYMKQRMLDSIMNVEINDDQEES